MDSRVWISPAVYKNGRKFYLVLLKVYETKVTSTYYISFQYYLVLLKAVKCFVIYI